MMKFVLLDLILSWWINLNHAWIRDVWWKMYMLMCLFLETEKIVLEHVMNTMKMIEIISRNVFWSFNSCFQRPACVYEYMNMYWSTVAYAWQNDWSWHVWPCTISIDWPTGLMKRSVSSSLARHIWISPHFDSGSQQIIQMHFLFSTSLHYFHVPCFMHFLIFLHLSKFISNWIMLQKIWGFLHCLPYCF
jgi:hypothetical protein